jgi:hypothetical protein
MGERRQHLRQILLPLSAATLGVYLLIGCIYIPGRDKLLPGQNDPRGAVGEATSDRPLRVGNATRGDVHSLLGLPHKVSEDGRTWTYQWQALNGSWFTPVCFYAEPALKRYAMRLEFGEDGRLKSTKVDGGVRGMSLYGGSDPDYLPRVHPAVTQPSRRQSRE